MDKHGKKRPEEDPVEGTRDVTIINCSGRSARTTGRNLLQVIFLEKVELHPGRQLIRKDESTRNNPMR
jgi:hypothetical protein